MNVLSISIMSGLIFCIAGVAFLLTSVAIWIFKEIREEIRLSKRPSKKCTYKRFHELDDWKTECGCDFHDATETGNPVTDWATYCPYCGGEIECKN